MKLAGAAMLLWLPAASADTLQDLIVRALQAHPAVLEQRAQQGAALAEADSARGQFLPTPSVAIERAQVRAGDPAFAGDATVSVLRLQQPLWTGGRLTAGVDKASAAAVINQASLDEVRQQLALRVVQAYGDWLAAQLKEQAGKKSLTTHMRLREQVQRRIDQGTSAESDMILAVGRLKSVLAEVVVAGSQRDIAQLRLGQLLGQPVETVELGAAVVATRPVSPVAQAAIDLALTINPTIQKALAQVTLRDAEIEERRAETLPEVYLRAERQFGDRSLVNASPQNRLYLGLNLRFGAGMSSVARVSAAMWQRQAAVSQVDVQRRAVSEQVLVDHSLALSTESRLEAVGASREASEQVAESFARQFLSGRKTWLDVMNAARELGQVEMQLAEIRASQVVVTWRLATYTQGLDALLGRRP